MAHHVDIIVPVFREEETFKEFYNTVVRSVTSPWRMLVVYDVPDDPTLTVIKMLATDDSRIIPLYNPTRGVANAITFGLQNATSEAIMIIAVDLLEDVKKIDEMLEILHKGGYSIVAPSRYMKGGERFAGKLLHRWLSRLASLSLYYLAGIPIHDATNGSKMLRKSFLDSINIESHKGWEIGLELTVKAAALKQPMTEIPVMQYRRKAGKSKFKLLKWLPAYLHWYWFAIKNNFMATFLKNR